jgi:CRP/FNR family nitrogen fixation transcriptional regulator
MGEEEPADYLYKIIRGAVRTYKVLIDGRRQIGAFYLPGDIFGLETGEEHAFSAETVVDSKVLVIKRSTVVSLATWDCDVARQLWTLTGRELQRT